MASFALPSGLVSRFFSARFSRLFIRAGTGIFVFIGIPLLISLGGLSWLESTAREEGDEQNRNRLSSLLFRLETLSHPVKRFEGILRNVAQKTLSPPILRRTMARLAKREGGALEIHLFSPSGQFEAGFGGSPPPRVFAERFLKSLISADHPSPPESMVEGYCGKNDGNRLFRETPGTFIDLMNSERKSFAGFWTFRDKGGRVTGHIIAFIHSGRISRDGFLDRAARSFNSRSGGGFVVGWLKPFEPDRLQPRETPFPSGLATTLQNIPSDQAGFLYHERPGWQHITSDGFVLFALLSHRPAVNSFTRLRLLVILLGLAAALLFIRFSGLFFPPIFLFSGKLTLLLAIGGGIPLAILLFASLIDRQNRENLLRESIRDRQIEQLAKIDAAYHAWQNRRFNHLEVFAHALAQLSPQEAIHRMQAYFPRLLNNSHGMIRGVFVVSRDGRAILELLTGNAERKGNQKPEALIRRLVHNTLKWAIKTRQPRQRLPLNCHPTPRQESEEAPPHLASAQPRSSSEPDLMADLDSYFNLGPGFFSGFGSMLQTYTAVVGQTRPEFLFLVIYDPQWCENAFIRDFSLKWNRKYGNTSKFIAMPKTSNSSLSPFPSDARRHLGKLTPLRETVLNSGMPLHRTIHLDGRELLISVNSAKALQHFVLMVTYPTAIILEEARRLNLQLAFLAAALLAGIGGLGWATSRVLLSPIHRLGKGLQALSQKAFDVRISGTRFEAAEFAQVAQQFNLIMENLKEMHSAKALQETLWPEADLIGPDWSVIGRCITAAELGGDFLDWFQFPDGRALFAAGDVAGHGVAAALITASAKAELFMHAHPDATPAEILNRMNRGFLRNTGRMKPMTCWLGMFDPDSGHLRFSTAGHPYPVLIHANGETETLEAPAWPLGARKATYQDGELHLLPDERLIVYSDGLIESADHRGEPFGYERFQELAAETAPLPPHKALDAIFHRIQTWSGLEVPLDDMTLVLLSRGPASPPTLPGGPT
jgi:serine phosphatase RsbU (regulator of sigma subunit)